MQKLLIKYLSVLILISALFCSKYQNLILIEFDNVERNRHFDYLRSALPNKIKNYPFFSTNFNIEYAGSIEPYLESNSTESFESVLLMGKFFVSNSQIKVSYNIYDMNNWEKILTKEFYCLSRDEDCINSSLLASLNNSFASLFSISDTDIDSAYTDSFQSYLLDSPYYTRPEVYRDLKVPEVLLSGHHEKIKDWKLKEKEIKTKNNRPDLWLKYKKECDTE